MMATSQADPVLVRQAQLSVHFIVTGKQRHLQSLRKAPLNGKSCRIFFPRNHPQSTCAISRDSFPACRLRMARTGRPMLNSHAFQALDGLVVGTPAQHSQALRGRSCAVVSSPLPLPGLSAAGSLHLPRRDLTRACATQDDTAQGNFDERATGETQESSLQYTDSAFPRGAEPVSEAESSNVAATLASTEGKTARRKRTRKVSSVLATPALSSDGASLSSSGADFSDDGEGSGYSSGDGFWPTGTREYSSESESEAGGGGRRLESAEQPKEAATAPTAAPPQPVAAPATLAAAVVAIAGAAGDSAAVPGEAEAGEAGAGTAATAETALEPGAAAAAEAQECYSRDNGHLTEAGRGYEIGQLEAQEEASGKEVGAAGGGAGGGQSARLASSTESGTPPPVMARLRRSLLEVLRRARAQHTEAAALRVMDEWWEQAHRSAASVDVLLGAVMELDAAQERKLLRQLLDWMVHVRRVRLPGTPAFNLLLRAAAGDMADPASASMRGLRRVELIFQEMQQRSVPADEETYEIIMEALALARQHERVIAAHRLLMSSGLEATTKTFQILLRSYCTAKDFTQAEQILHDLARRNEGLRVEDLNALLFALSSEGKAAHIHRILEELLSPEQTALASPPTPSSELQQPPSTSIGGDEGAGSPSAGDGHAGWPQPPSTDGGERGAAPGVRPKLPVPNSASMRALLRAYATSGQPWRGRDILALVRTHRIPPDPKLLTELVSAFAAAGSPSEAEATLMWAVGSGHVSFKTESLRGRGSRGRGGAGAGALTEVEAQQQWLPLYTSLVFAYAYQGLWAEAYDVIREMQHVMPLCLDERPFNVLMGEMAQAGEARRAQSVLRLMQSAGIAPQASSFKTLARAFCSAGEPEKAEAVLLQMQAQGWRVSEEALVPVLDAYALCRRPSEVERVVGSLEAFGLRCTPAIETALIGALCLVGLPRAAETVFNKAFPPGERRPTVLACAWLVAAYTALGDESSAARVAAVAEAAGLAPSRAELEQILDAHWALGKKKEAQLIAQHAHRLGIELNYDSSQRKGGRRKARPGLLPGKEEPWRPMYLKGLPESVFGRTTFQEQTLLEG